MSAKPYRLAGDSVRAAVTAALRPGIAQWARDWFASAPKSGIAIDAKLPADIDEDWLVFGDDDCWLALPAKSLLSRDFLRLLLSADIAGNTPGALAEQVVQDCIADLAQRCLALANALEPAAAAVRASVRTLHVGPGSGAVFATLQGDLPAQRLLLGGGLVAALSFEALPPAICDIPLAPRRSGIADGVTQVEVSLGEAELSLAELAGIAVGDVLALDALSRDPLTVRTIDGNPVFSAHLGLAGEHKAIQIISTYKQ